MAGYVKKTAKNKKELQVLTPTLCGSHCLDRDPRAYTSPLQGRHENVGQEGDARL